MPLSGWENLLRLEDRLSKLREMALNEALPLADRLLAAVERLELETEKLEAMRPRPGGGGAAHER